MNGTQDKSTREERLAIKLRENLRRRKEQGRAIAQAPETPPHQSGTDGASTLSKPEASG